MTKIRLLRMGCHKNPFFRLVVADHRAKSNGKYIELVGHYNPLDGKMVVNEYVAIKWLADGAQATDTAKSVLQKQGIWKKFTDLKQSKQLTAYLEEQVKKQKENASKKSAENEAKRLEAEKQRQELKRLAQEKAAKAAAEKAEQAKKDAEEAARKAEQKRLEDEAKREAAERAKKAEEERLAKEATKKEVKLQIKEDSKIIKKISEEELKKRETQTFEVVEHDDEDMDDSAPKTIMVSLDKAFIEKIISEEKDILFFKRLPVQKVERVLVYSVKPIGKVVGEFDLKSTNVLSKTKSWKELGARSVFRKKEFDEYFKDQEDVKVMELDGFIKYSNDRPLSDFKLQRGPSGFCYLK